MLVLGLIGSVFGVGFFCWLMFTLAIYALPFYVGLTAALSAFHDGAGAVGAFFVGVFAAGAVLAIGQVLFASIRSLAIRLAIAAIYALPAGVAGFHVTAALVRIGGPTELWCEIFGYLGAVAIGAAAFGRIAAFAPPEPVQRSMGDQPPPFTRRPIGA